MKPTIYILGLAIVLLFFAGCGEKEESPLKSKTVAVKDGRTLPLSVKSIKSNSPADLDFQNKNLRPIIVTVLESGCFSPGAVVRVEKTTDPHALWEAKTDKNGVAKVYIPIDQTYFRITAIKGSYAIASSYTSRLAPGITPVYVELSLEESGVVITAKLITDKNIDKEDLYAKIMPERKIGYQRSRAVTSVHSKDNKITFPPIKQGTERLRIIVKVNGFAESYSDYFNTTNSKDKTVEVKLLSSVKLSGNAIRSDGMVITNFHIYGYPRGIYEAHDSPGHISQRITTDENGAFEIEDLLPEHYSINFSPTDAYGLRTNILLYSDSKNYIELVFPKLQHRNINGTVKYEQSDTPAEGIEVKCVVELGQKKIFKTITDKDGRFSFFLPIGQFNSTLIVNESGYAKSEYIFYKNIKREIVFLLYETGTLMGTIKTESGNPLSGIKVRIIPNSSPSSAPAKKAKNTVSLLSDYTDRKIISTCEIQSKYYSNESGAYIISNIASPQLYSIIIDQWEDNNYYFPLDYEKKIKIEPGETTIHDITMYRKPIVLVKLKDQEGSPVLRYLLRYELKYKGSSSGNGDSVNLSDDDWFRIDVCGIYTKGKLSLEAKTKDWRYAKVKDIIIDPDKTNKILLTLSDIDSPDVSGFVYRHDMNPLIGRSIHAKSNDESGNGYYDYNGYFVITGMGVKRGDKIELTTHYEENIYRTNVFAGKNDVIWTLPKPHKICGRVCIGDIHSPATNFTFSIINKYSKTFYSQDGFFSLPVDKYNIENDFEIKISVPGYLPEYITGNFDDFKISNPYNIGDIIILKPSTITGRIVDNNSIPLNAFVSLMEIKDDSKPKDILNVRNDKTDGTFKFTGLPPGNYYIKASAEFAHTKSDLFELYSNEIYSLPDLMINNTNVTEVLFEFILPDGTKAANVKVNHFNKFTDENGYLKSEIIHGKYRGWKIRIDEKLYSSDIISINSDTKNITVKLDYLPSICGTVTLDDQPLESGNLIFYNKNNSASTRISDGKFEVKAVPGKYTVNSNNGAMGIIELSESGPNKINLRNGTGRSRIEIIR